MGTGAARLQGVDLPVGDIDLLLDRRSDVDAVAAALAPLPCPAPPRWIEVTRQYFACYELDGVGFSFSTLEQSCDDDGWKCKGPAPWRHSVTVDCGGHRIGCVRLELRLTTEFLRNRPDRYRPILTHLTTHGADLEPLDQSLTIRNVPDPLAQLAHELPAISNQ